MAITTESTITKAERRKLLTTALGSAFDPYERVFGAYDGGVVFDYGEFEAADIATMLRRDGKARSVDLVLSLPLRGASWKLDPDKGDNGELDVVTANLGDKIGKLIDQCTTAIAFRRAYFETTWKLDGTKIVYDEILLRPPTGCEAGFDPKTGKPKGFRQRIVPVAGIFPTQNYDSVMPGYVVVKPNRAFVYTHGAYRDPIKGLSDLDVAFWNYETKQKILFLLFQFLENQSLPKTVVYGDDIDQATELAGDVAQLKSSGVLGLPRPSDPTAKAFEVLESGGKGAQQFMDAIRYLDTQMVASVMAGFTELADTGTASRTGSYALSADQSEFFLASRQAVADEIADAIRDGVIAPLVWANFGPDAAVPKLTIGPLSNRKTERALALLQAVVAAPNLNIPAEFVDQLTQSVASYLGLDAGQVKAAIELEVKRRAEAAAMKTAQQKQLLANPIPPKGGVGVPSPMAKTPGAVPQSQQAALTPKTPKAPTDSAPVPKGAPTPQPPKVGPVNMAAEMSTAVDVAAELVRAARDGDDPHTVLDHYLES